MYLQCTGAQLIADCLYRVYVQLYHSLYGIPCSIIIIIHFNLSQPVIYITVHSHLYYIQLYKWVIMYYLSLSFQCFESTTTVHTNTHASN